MQTPTQTLVIVVALLTTLAGGAVMPSTGSANQMFASPSVMSELRGTRPGFTALPPDEQAIVYLWLQANCAVGAEDQRTQFVKLSTGVEAALIESFRMGPPTALLTELADTRHRDFAAIKVRLDGEDSELFDPELRERLAGLSEDAYVKEGISHTITSYRIAALDGLALIGSATTIAWLERTAPTLRDPDLIRAAERTRATLRERIRN